MLGAGSWGSAVASMATQRAHAHEFEGTAW